MAAVIKTKRERKKRVVWIKPWLQRRGTHGIFATLVEELRLEDQSDYTNYFRMTSSEFDEIFARVENKILKKDTRMREAIPAEAKLAITLRFVATGESYQSLQYQYRIHRSTIAKFIPEVCDALFPSLRDDHMKTPNTKDECGIFRTVLGH